MRACERAFTCLALLCGQSLGAQIQVPRPPIAESTPSTFVLVRVLVRIDTGDLVTPVPPKHRYCDAVMGGSITLSGRYWTAVDSVVPCKVEGNAWIPQPGIVVRYDSGQAQIMGLNSLQLASDLAPQVFGHQFTLEVIERGDSLIVRSLVTNTIKRWVYRRR